MKNFKLGFTLVELLIVIAIIGILAASLLVTLDPIEQINKSRDGATIGQAKEVINGCERFYAFNEVCVATGTPAAACAALVTAGELKAVAPCANLTAVTCSATGTCTASFTPLSKHYKAAAKCGASCLVPDDI